jgi:hypothetical protein
MINLCIILAVLLVYLIGTLTGIILHKKFRHPAPWEVTGETVMLGRVYRIGFSYDPIDDKDGEEFKKKSKLLCKALEKTFYNYERRNIDD